MNLGETLQKLRIKHFTVSEITKGKKIPEEVINNIAPTILFVEYMRANLKFPITITSSYRTWEHHVEIYKSMGVQASDIPKDSLHLVFNALDIVPVSGTRVHLNKMQSFVKIPFSLYFDTWGKTIQFDNSDLGVGYYHTFLHVDSRGTLERPSPKFWGTPI